VFDLTLSFDNGPEPDATPHVLDTPARCGIKATFSVIGEKLLDPERRRLAERARRGPPLRRNRSAITPFVSTIEERFAP
jgi:peptidoglycan/xylan/chitin deacetylase (PgdA/CDA1 family)